jgi:hypothetical protein
VLPKHVEGPGSAAFSVSRVLLGAALVRLLLVLLWLIGPRGWYVPRWVDRRLPDVGFGLV